MKKISKIAIIIPRLHAGGAERVVTGLANYCISKEIQVSIIRYDKRKPFYDIDNNVNIISLDIYFATKNIFQKIYYNFKRIFLLRRVLKKIQPNIAISFLPSACCITLIALLGMNIPLVMTERNNPYLSPSNKIWRLLRSHYSYFADGYIFQTRRARDYFSKKVIQNSVVIFNPIINPYLTTVTNGEKEKTITAMGRLVPQKGFVCLIKAFSRITNDFPDYSLHIYGEGVQREELQKIIDNMNLSDKIYLKGSNKKAIEPIIKSSVFVLSSRFEGMPNALIEAMAGGVPCISTDCPMGPSELIKNGENGILVPVDDDIMMAEAMKRILLDTNLAKRLSDNAIKINELLSEDIIFKQYLDYLVQVLNKS